MKKHISTLAGFDSASGTIDYSFTNDYMFRAILQKNKRVLKALICALLHLEANDISSISITNPIELGKSISSKDFVLDISILMNDNTFINLEMQIKNQLNWEERSLSYLCRSFDQLYNGDDYKTAGPAIHIGILDYTPFKDSPEFYATYKLLNVKNHRLYSDKFILSVVDLTKIDMAADIDKAYQIDRWAKLFKATTWEEIKMIAEKDENLLEATETLYSFNSDETIRAQCRARADYYRLQNTIKLTIEELTTDKKRLAQENDRLSSEIDRISSENDKLSSENNTLSSEIDKLSSEIESLKKLLEEKMDFSSL
jgi:predicted transposase/invertase (TIGR01784 family)